MDAPRVASIKTRLSRMPIPETVALLAAAAFLFRGREEFLGLPPARQVARCLASSLVGLCAGGSFFAFFRGKELRARLSEAQKGFLAEWALLFGMALAFFGSWLLGQWPALFSYDTYAAYRDLRFSLLNEWWSSLYSLYLMVFQEISVTPGLVAGVQAAAVSALLGYGLAFARLHGVHRWISRGWLLLFFTPLNGSLTVFLSRDIVFSWLFLTAALFLPWYQIRGKGARPGRSVIVFYSLVVACVAKLRLDGLVILPLAPLFLRFACNWGRDSMKAFILTTMKCVGVVFLAIPMCAGFLPLSAKYSVSAIVNPLSELVQRPYDTSDRAADILVIDRVLDYSFLKTHFDPLEIPAFHHGIRPSATDGDIRKLQILYAKMVLRNPGPFLANRWTMFKALMGISPGAYYASNDLEQDYPFAAESRAVLHLAKAPVSAWLHDGQLRAMAELTKDSFLARAIYSNALPLLLTLAALLCFRVAPASAAAAALVLARLFVISLLAPASQFKYVYSMYLFGLAIPLFVWMEARSRAAVAKR